MMQDEIMSNHKNDTPEDANESELFILQMMRKNTEFMKMVFQSISKHKQSTTEEMNKLKEDVIYPLKSELKDKLKNELKDALWADIKGEIDQRGQNEEKLEVSHTKKIKDEIKMELTSELTDFQSKMKNEIKKDIMNNLIESLQPNLRDWISKEVTTQLKEKSQTSPSNKDERNLMSNENTDELINLRQQLNETKQTVQELKKDLDAHVSLAQSFHTFSSTIYSKIEEIENSSKESRKILEDRLSSLDNLFNSEIDTIEGIKTRNDEYKKQIDKLQIEISQLKSDSKINSSKDETNPETNSESNASRLESLQTSYETMRQSINQLIDFNKAMQEDVVEIQETLASHAEVAKTNAQNITMLASKVNDITDAYNESTEKNHENFQVVQANVEEIAIAYDNIRETVNSHIDDLKELEKRLVALQDRTS